MENKQEYTIQISWSTDDILGERPDLSFEQAKEVLEALESNHDASIGINWDVINDTADNMFPRPEESDEE